MISVGDLTRQRCRAVVFSEEFSVPDTLLKITEVGIFDVRALSFLLSPSYSGSH